jgi:hypothetical protein
MTNGWFYFWCLLLFFLESHDYDLKALSGPFALLLLLLLVVSCNGGPNEKREQTDRLTD